MSAPHYRFDHKNRILIRSHTQGARLWLWLLLLILISGASAWHFRDYWLAWLTQITHDTTPALAWAQLQSLDYLSGDIPPDLQAYVGQRVKIPGFIVLLDAHEDALTEFLLVPVYGMCIHIPPPPPNLMIYVRASPGIPAHEWMSGGVWLKGILHIEHVESEYGAAGFRISDAVLEPLGGALPEPIEDAHL
jgi:hypothetical protein